MSKGLNTVKLVTWPSFCHRTLFPGFFCGSQLRPPPWRGRPWGGGPIAGCLGRPGQQHKVSSGFIHGQESMGLRHLVQPEHPVQKRLNAPTSALAPTVPDRQPGTVTPYTPGTCSRARVSCSAQASQVLSPVF